ncbi:hypothetical protein [Dactylosporangium sp. CA-139066]|uniref:hypothetical protein n=1 Tax=Dactylosporangium sp. CA-139066 TaxID=3239930 RepID=UPI003D8DB7C1
MSSSATSTASPWPTGPGEIDIVRHDDAAAAPRLATALDILAWLQRAGGVALVGEQHGRVLLARGGPTRPGAC